MRDGFEKKRLHILRFVDGSLDLREGSSLTILNCRNKYDEEVGREGGALIATSLRVKAHCHRCFTTPFVACQVLCGPRAGPSFIDPSL